MKTRRDASREGCSPFNLARAAATSGRSCSAACRVFFEGDRVPFIEAPDRGRSGLQLLLRAEAGADLLERQIGLGSYKIEQPLLVLLERRAAMAGAGLGIAASPPPPRPGPTGPP